MGENRYENFKKEEQNMLLTKIEGGYMVFNFKTFKGYKIMKNNEGRVECNCPDYKRRKKPCKHLYKVKFGRKDCEILPEKEDLKKKEVEENLDKYLARW